MKQIIHTIIVLSMLNTVSGQTVRGVGINVKKPKQTLDIGGSLRIDSVSFVNKEDFEPLSWNEKGETAADGTVKNQGKIIAFKDDNNAPIKTVVYRIKIDRQEEDWVDGIDLGIPKDKYTVILMDYALLEENLDLVYIKLLGSQKMPGAFGGVNRRNTAVYLRSKDEERGKIGLTTDTNSVNDKDLSDGGGDIDVITGSPLIMTYPDSQGPNWRFYADYPSTTATSFGEDPNTAFKVTGRVPKNYKWQVTFLVVDKTYMRRNENLYDVEVNNSGEGQFNQSIDPVTGLPPVN